MPSWHDITGNIFIGTAGAIQSQGQLVIFKEMKSGLWYVKKSTSIVGKFQTEEQARNEAFRLKTAYPKNAVSYYQDSVLKAYV